ncbi:hypothetical protein AAG906_009762 [Vitis piasezkii]
MAIGKRTATMTDFSHRSVQPQITIFASAICYECMSVEIGELLGVVMMTTSSKGFLMNKMSFVHLFKMVMIFNFHIGGIFNKEEGGSKEEQVLEEDIYEGAEFAEGDVGEEVACIVQRLLLAPNKPDNSQRHKIFRIAWIKKGPEVQALKVCKVPLSIEKYYKHEIICDVVDMDACIFY